MMCWSVSFVCMYRHLGFIIGAMDLYKVQCNMDKLNRISRHFDDCRRVGDHTLPFFRQSFRSFRSRNGFFPVRELASRDNVRKFFRLPFTNFFPRLFAFGFGIGLGVEL